MTANYRLILTINGTADEIRAMVEIVSLYTGERPQYFYDFEVNGKPVDFENLTDEIIAELVSPGHVKITAFGPFGGYGLLNEVGLFRELSEIAGNAFFSAEISGSGCYEVQNLKCEYMDGKLRITDYIVDNEELDEAWVDNFVEKLPVQDFMKMFKITGDVFDSKIYRSIVESMNRYSEWMMFHEFVSLIEDYGAETELDEDEFYKIVWHELPLLKIKLAEDFLEDYGDSKTEEHVYNPATKSYEGNSKSMFTSGIAEDANGLLAEGLKAMGLPSDEEALANLSVEEAYEALAAALYEDYGDEDNA